MSPTILILAVDDEELVLDVLAHALEDAGYAVTRALSGEAAIDLVSSGAEIKALVTDVNLEGKISGWDVAKHAREQQPEIPVVYVTGDSAHQWPSMGVPNSVLVPKPFAPAQIVTAVSQLLNVAISAAAPPPPTL